MKKILAYILLFFLISQSSIYSNDTKKFNYNDVLFFEIPINWQYKPFENKLIFYEEIPSEWSFTFEFIIRNEDKYKSPRDVLKESDFFKKDAEIIDLPNGNSVLIDSAISETVDGEVYAHLWYLVNTHPEGQIRIAKFVFESYLDNLGEEKNKYYLDLIHNFVLKTEIVEKVIEINDN